MSSQSALALKVAPTPEAAPAQTLDLCRPIYLRNYALHQAAQESISQAWADLLAQ